MCLKKIERYLLFLCHNLIVHKKVHYKQIKSTRSVYFASIKKYTISVQYNYVKKVH